MHSGFFFCFYNKNGIFGAGGKLSMEWFTFFFLDAESNRSLAYFYFDSKCFEHFHFLCELFENDQRSKERTNATPVNTIVKIGVVGHYTNDDLKLIPKGNATFFN